MKKLYSIGLVVFLGLGLILTGCGKETSVSEEKSGATKLTMLNIKGEVQSQIEELAKTYQQETGVEVEVMGVTAGVDAQAALKGYYLSDQMPDIIACEAAGFGNWEGLLMDMSDQEWASRTEAAYVDSTYGTIGFPYTTEAIGLIYNANVLSQAGIDPASLT